MNDEEIVAEFKVRVQKIFSEAEIFFYGSRVKKNHSKDSDFDVLVLTKRFSPKIRDKICQIAWEIGFAHDVVIVPIICRQAEFYQPTQSTFLTAVKREGVRL